MSDTTLEDKRFMESKLSKALDEAWSKVNIAFDQVSNHSRESLMSIWYAAEAAEYASLLFNLTHGLDYVDPQPSVRRKKDARILVKDSLESLGKARELGQKSITEAYANLRAAADGLKTAYLDGLKQTEKSPR